jgi:hypothetical protein
MTMKLDRETFLTLALGMAACNKNANTGPIDEAAAEKIYMDPDCTGFDAEAYPMKCVAWKSGKIIKGYAPTDECVRWNDDGQCTAMAFVESARAVRTEGE